MSNKATDPIEIYLTELSAELSTLPKQQQADIIAEMRAHIADASAENDDNPDATLADQLGKAADFGNNMQTAYRTHRVIDFLLCALPVVLLPMLVNIISTRLYPIESFFRFQQMWLAALYLPLILVALRRPSAESSLFWLSTGIVTFAASALRNDWTMGTQFALSWVETSIYTIVCVGLVVIFGRILRQHRDDPLLLFWASIPFITALLSIASSFTIARLIDPSSIGGRYYIHAIVQLFVLPLGIAFFIFPSKRMHRWAGLLLFMIMMLILKAILFWPDQIWHPVYLASVALVGITFTVAFQYEQRFRGKFWLNASN